MADHGDQMAPVMDPPERWCPTAWDGEWFATFAYGPHDDQGEPIWMREYRLLDGHEDCCNHKEFVVVPRPSHNAREAR